MSDMDECLHLEDIQSDAVDRDAVFEICNQFVESQLKHDFELRNPATSLELERLGEDSINVPETASSTEVNNVCPNSGDDDGDKSEYLPLTPTLCAVLQDNGGLEINEFINSENVKDDRSKLPVNNCCTISDIQSRNKSDSRGDTSTLNCGLLVGKNNSRKSFEEQDKLAISLSYEAAKVPCEENNSPLEYHEQLHEKNELFEVPPEFNLRVEVADESESGNPCGLPEHKLVGQEIRETVTKNLSEESFVVDALVRSTYENSLVDDRNIMPITSVTNNQYPVAVDSIDEYYDLPELQKPYLVEVQLDHDARGLHLNGDFLLAKKTCSKEVMEEIVLEGSILEQNILDSQTITELDDGSLNVDEKAETLQMGDAQRGSIEVFPLDANLKCCIDTRFGHENMLIHEPNSKIESSAKLGDHQIPEAVNSKSVKLSDLSKKSVGPVTNDLTLCGKILQGSEVTVSKSRTLAEEAESNVFCNNECPDTEMQHDLEKTMSGTGDSNKTIQLGSNKSGNKSKQDALVIKPPPDAAPFSDEWLAAFEAAGEDILTIKSGAVQNSPPDKPPHELGPWSPVKRKTNQAIGPFDCTKYTSIPPSGSQ
ncbi:Retrovirus-related Pol polyprotein from transposon TNT 1-94 [Quillaja saponaria]|uniref:Retrovirus-related Pol polyprotein from transposon TNT 1-94 n=1 Tax=Quillaja saponaria TaxID=32244 RepID=A0AAD7QGN0_QUISA|nr:Retrovirus-related Pol polyprotein from transposon TNT 1-94 [Quillaja saponaria]